jgi:hypothetical protein
LSRASEFGWPRARGSCLGGRIYHRRASDGRVSHGRVPHRPASHERACHGCASYERASRGRVSHGVYITGVHLIGVHLTVVYLMCMHFMNVHLTGVLLTDVYLIGVHLTAVYLYESSLRAGHGWRESPYRHQGHLKASDCGRLGRQARWPPLERAPRGEKPPKRPSNSQGAARSQISSSASRIVPELTI